MTTRPVEAGTTGFVPASGWKLSIATPPPVRETVTVLPEAEVTTPEPPAMVIAPLEGRAVPVSPRRELSDPVPAESSTHVAETTLFEDEIDASVHTFKAEVFSHL